MLTMNRGRWWGAIKGRRRIIPRIGGRGRPDIIYSKFKLEWCIPVGTTDHEVPEGVLFSQSTFSMSARVLD
jgi:hypothetical protein